jgi:hypothetical protein
MVEASLPRESQVPPDCRITAAYFQQSLPPGERISNYYEFLHGEWVEQYMYINTYGHTIVYANNSMSTRAEKKVAQT